MDGEQAEGLWKVRGRTTEQKAGPKRAGSGLTGEGTAGCSRNILA